MMRHVMDKEAGRQSLIGVTTWAWQGVALLALAACGQAGVAEAPATPATRSQPAMALSRIPEAPPASAAPMIRPYAFELRISLSDAAATKLLPAKEGIVAVINYVGDPTSGAGDRFVDELGFIDLGQMEVDVTGKSRVVIDGRALKTDMLKYLQGEPRVIVNIASGRRVFEDNLLDCGSFEDDLKVAIAKPVVLHCELLDWPARRIQ